MGIIEGIKKGSREAIIGQVCRVLEKNPQKNVDKIFSVAKKLAKDNYSKMAVENIEDYYNEIPTVKDEIQDILANTNSNCLQKFFKNFLANAIWNGVEKRQKWLDEENTKIPFVILLSPSMRCNLRCSGCYAADYPKDQGLSFEEVDKIVGEARDLGIHYMVILGGEPFFVDYMYKIYEKYNDVMFTPFTNGTLFNDDIADKLSKLGNVMPMFSLEGFEKETDDRRGKGVFNKVMNGMDLLKTRGIPFGVSSATTTHNIDTVSSERFIDMLIEKGSRMSWYFIYMPVGEKPNIENMLKPEQRIELGRRVRNIRMTKPYFAIDFFNDAPYVGGCIAGKYYCHINSSGDVEPCIFAHIAADNVKNKKLIDVFRGELFKELRVRQPYNKNMLRPCMMIDNPNVIREVAKKVKAHPTDKSAEAMLNDKEFQEKLNKLSDDFKTYADEAWEKDFHSKGNDEFAKG
ncbi:MULTISPECIES: radical SAM protein [Clostridium]|uniref:Radical SAM protein n=1 Tax=Clostridium cibarium TaxID=2762247 RepID=A0ABR8PPS8_9CLOT|nr:MULTISPECIES: radical SAM protein [Clostridium]MBD7910171.1 radical SAM protein [Clostridium cibarium]